MKRPALLIVTVLVAVGLAGCAGPADPPTSEPTTTDAPPTDRPALGLPDTITEQTLNATHVQTLRDAGSFTLTQRDRMTTKSDMKSETRRTKQTVKADFADTQYLRTATSHYSGGVVRFTNATATYKKIKPEDPDRNATYTKSRHTDADDGYQNPNPVNVTKALTIPTFNASTNGTITYEKVGTTTFRGTPVAEYRLTNESQHALTTGVLSTYNVSTATVRLYLDANQTVRQAYINFSVRDETRRMQYTRTTNWTAIGNTEVQTPAWVQTAEQETDD